MHTVTICKFAPVFAERPPNTMPRCATRLVVFKAVGGEGYHKMRRKIERTREEISVDERLRVYLGTRGKRTHRYLAVSQDSTKF